jgi:PKD repeat protein
MRYLWNFGDGNRSTAVNPTHTYARPGRYEVCLTITTPEGCTDTKCQWVSTATPPVDTTRRSICFNVRLSDGRTLADSYTVILYRLDPATNRWVPVDTLTNLSTTVNSGPVCFNKLPAGQYIALGQLTPRSQFRTSHIPTYYDRSQTWRNARIIDLRQSNPAVILDLVLLPRLRVNGPARAAGRAAAPGKTSSVGVGAWVMAIHTATNEPVALSETDIEGRYTLEGLPYGTYRLVAEAINFHDRPVLVTLSPDAPVAAQNDIDLSEEPAPTSRSSKLSFGDLTLYPNPTTGLVWVKAPWLTGDNLKLTVLGTDGRVVRELSVSPTEGIDLTDLPQGLYLLRVVQGQHAATRSLLLN